MLLFISAGINYVKGFEVTRYDLSNQLTCFILDLSNITWDENSMEGMNVCTCNIYYKSLKNV